MIIKPFFAMPPGYRSVCIRIFVYIVFLIALRYAYIAFLESRSIFFPVKKLIFSPKSIGRQFDEVSFVSADKKELHGWFIPAPAARLTVLFCHGNAGNLQDRLEKIDILNNLGVNIFIFDYRGYGRSKGRPTEKGVYLDAAAAYEYVTKVRLIAANTIVVYGESIGAAVAIDLAKSAAVKGMILEGSFSSGRDMAKIMYPFLPRFTVPDLFNSLAKIPGVRCPVLFIHSVDDEIVPIALAKKLYDAAPGNKKFIELHGEHNEAFFLSQVEYMQALKDFLNSLERGYHETGY